MPTPQIVTSSIKPGNGKALPEYPSPIELIVKAPAARVGAPMATPSIKRLIEDTAAETGVEKMQ
jgi:hypothetical protein